MFQFNFAGFPFIVIGKFFSNNFKCTVASFTVEKFVICSLVREISYILVTFLHGFYDEKRQLSPNPCYYVKALINLYPNVNF